MNANGQLTNGIAAYWKLDETSGSIVNDSYSSNDGTITNATINQTGILGNGVSFDGSGDYILCGNSSSLDIGTSDWSFSCWFKTTANLSSSSNLYTIFSNGSSTTAGIDIILRGSTPWNGILVRLCDGSSYYDFKPESDLSSTISNGAWHHLAVTLDRDGDLVIYLNNSAVQTVSIAAHAAKNFYHSFEHRIGILSYNYSFDGTLDEIGIWNKALTTSEVSQLCNSGNGLSYPFGSITPVTRVEMNKTSTTIDIGETVQIYAQVYPLDATNKNVTWNSSNTSIVTVNSSGIVTGVATGNATITVTTQDGGFTDECSITVTEEENNPPIANAGDDKLVIDEDNDGIESVFLHGFSTDPDGDMWSCVWIEGGIQILMASMGSVDLTVGVHTITLIVTDEHGLTDTDDITVTVRSAEGGGEDANWQIASNGIYYVEGNVGIGTIAPEGQLHIDGDMLFGGSFNRDSFKTTGLRPLIYAAGNYFEGSDEVTYGSLVLQSRPNYETPIIFSTNGNEKVRIHGNGNVGIGTTNPEGGLHIATDTYSGLVLQRVANSVFSPYRAQLGISSTNDIYGLRIRVSNDEGSTYNDAIFVQHDGKVGIGTLAPDVALTVNGDIKAERIDIIADVPSSDHIFRSDYKLMNLHELDAFIKTNKHLPEVPSAEEFKENGYSVGEMDDLLLRKIEELTLYIITLEKRIKELEKK